MPQSRLLAGPRLRTLDEGLPANTQDFSQRFLYAVIGERCLVVFRSAFERLRDFSQIPSASAHYSEPGAAYRSSR